MEQATLYCNLVTFLMEVSAFPDHLFILSSTLISLIIMVSFYVSEQFLLPGRQNALHCLMFLDIKIIDFCPHGV